jgi:hypothetical protein
MLAPRDKKSWLRLWFHCAANVINSSIFIERNWVRPNNALNINRRRVLLL